MSLENRYIKNLILSSAPERLDEINDIWEANKPQFNIKNDDKGFTLEAGAFGLILFDHKTLAQIWLLSFSATKALTLYQGYLLNAEISGMPFSPINLAYDDEELKLKLEITEILRSIKELQKLDDISKFSWPSNIPSPYNGKPADLEGGMSFDLLCIGSAFCFLHELNHVILRNEQIELAEHEEEFQCDKFARNFLLENIFQYAQSEGCDLDKVKSKRCMAIAFATMVLFAATPTNQWLGSRTHPSSIERLRVLLKEVDLTSNDKLWPYLSSILIVVCKENSINLSDSYIKCQKIFCFEILKMIESHLTKQSTRC